MIAIVDYGLGNLGSIQNMLRAIGQRAEITSSPDKLAEADKLILPGVGAFDAGMARLHEAGLSELVVRLTAEQRKPILGICLGMQMLGHSSEEGKLPGLDLVSFECKRFSFDDTNLKVPHMGWDVVTVKQDNPLTRDISDGERYYFVHSYHAVCDSSDNVLMSCEYGYEFAAAVVSGNVYGVQFHPEKSHDIGMKLLKNFAEAC